MFNSIRDFYRLVRYAEVAKFTYADSIEPLKENYSERLKRSPGPELDTLYRAKELEGNQDTLTSIKIYELYREKISHEDLLINFRTTWFIALQAFLFTALALSIGDNNGRVSPFIAVIFGSVGVATSFVTLVSIHAAHAAINVTTRKWAESYHDLKNNRYINKGVRDIVDPMGLLPAVKGAGANRFIALRGQFATYGMTLFLGFFWAVLIWLAWPILISGCETRSTEVSQCIIGEFQLWFNRTDES